MEDVCVIGAGISGLSTAAYLTEAGLSVRVLEKEKRVGGTMRTVKEDGYLIDFGPNTVVLNTPHLQEMIDWSKMANSICSAGKNASKRWVVKNNVLIPLPLGPGSFMSTPLFSWKAKARLLKEPFISRGPKGESVADFAIRRLGNEFFQYAIDPFVSGVYAGNPRQLSVEFATAKIHALEKKYGSLIKGLFLGAKERAKKRKQLGETDKTKARIVNFKEGVASLTQNISKRLSNAIYTGCQVTHITKNNQGYLVEYVMDGATFTTQCRSLVFSVPANSLHQLCGLVDNKYQGNLNALPYAPVVQVFLGYKQRDINHPLDGFGVLFPQVEKSKILGALMNASMFPGRAPEGHTALTCFLGGMCRPSDLDLSDDQLIANSHQALSRVLPIQNQPVFSKIKRYPSAIPQYQLDYPVFLEQMTQMEKRNPNLYIGGNCKGGISVADCVTTARGIVDSIISKKNSKRPNT